MGGSYRTPKERKKRTKTPANPVAFSLRDRRFKQRIVKSKVKYDRKRSHKGCDNLSQP